MSSEALQKYAASVLEKLPAINQLQKLVKEAPAWKLGLGAGLSYMALVRLLRYHKRNSVARKYPYKTRDDFGKMTADDAQAILKLVFEVEFPFLAEKALQFALFRSVAREICYRAWDSDEIWTGHMVFLLSANCWSRPSSCQIQNLRPEYVSVIVSAADRM